MPDHPDRAVVRRPDPVGLAERSVVALLTVDGDGHPVAAYPFGNREPAEGVRCAAIS